ncbi:MAG: glycosylase [Mogibacterium sp.]|nr:glycosylase [Mogibacterium sp.]
MAHWLDKAVFYEIYPQSFCDSNGDGIGDFAGIKSKIPYLKSLGVNAVWMNPCYDSSFYDAGYDVRDHYKAAERYGSNDDLKDLFEAFHAEGMHILLDLVPGHTAIDNPWFIESSKDEVNEYTDRFIWRTGGPWGKQYKGIANWLCGFSERPGAAAVNCFSSQPALNYGFANVTEDWQFSSDSPEAEKTRLAMQDIMSYWLDMGCDGFRVDMAGSLVKEDEDRMETMKLWQKVRAFLDEKYPDAALVSEWGNPLQALQAGFHMDFLLHGGPSHYMDLFRTEPYFSKSGRDELAEFMAYYNDAYAKTAGKGLICIPSGNHDMVRMRDTLTPDEMKLAFAFLLTMPGCPFIYYGDEIAMKYIHGLKSKEGGYDRTGSRTPMQWSKDKNAGFSSADPADLYLPVDDMGSYDMGSKDHADADSGYPNATDQMADPDSLWNHIRGLIEFRLAHPALDSNAKFRFLSDGNGYPLVYERWNDGDVSSAERLIIAINPSAETADYSLEGAPDSCRILLSYNGAEITDTGIMKLPAGSYAILKDLA